MSAGAFAAPLLLALLPCPRARVQDEPGREAPTSEGALNNDVFAPGADSAAAALASGDKALQLARAAAASGTTAEAQRQLDVAFDHWRNALVAGGAGASTWLAVPENEEQRLSEGVHAGVVRRLSALAADERARWSARHAAAAELALAALHDGLAPAPRADRLGELARLYPQTPACARAALELGDLALEAGLSARARGWYARAHREAGGSGASALLAALEARAARVAAPRAAATEAWQRAAGCDLVDSFSWSDPGRSPRASAAENENGLRPGGSFVGPGHFAVQTGEELLLAALGPRGELELVERRRLADLLGGYAPGEFEAPREPPGWPLLSVADELGLVLVVGRTDSGEPNALVSVALELPEAPLDLGLQLGTLPPATRLAWAIVGSERIDASGSVLVPELEELGPYEFQPGPIVSGDLVVVQARQFDGQVRSHLLAFDRRDGALAWRRQLAAGADRVVTPRFGQTSKRVAGQPLLALEVEGEPRVFAGTHLGLGVLVDPLAGEPLWSFKNRRRDPRAAGWGGARPVLGSGPDGGVVVLWAPMDSDRLYCLLPRALAGSGAGPQAVLSTPPEPLADAQALLGGDASEQLVLGRTGRARVVSARRAGHDRIDALELGPDERFAGTGAVSPERVWVASDRGLYLLDRTRELYLLDHDALPSPPGETLGGGDVHARGQQVLVLGSGTLWSFRVR